MLLFLELMTGGERGHASREFHLFIQVVVLPDFPQCLFAFCKTEAKIKTHSCLLAVFIIPYPASHLQQRRGTASSRHIQHLVRTLFSVQCCSSFPCIFNNQIENSTTLNTQSSFFSSGLNQIFDIHQTEKHSTQVTAPPYVPESSLCNIAV